MTHAQFIHLDTFGRTPRSKSNRHATAIGILNEAARVDNSSQHIEVPQPPRALYGPEPTGLITEVRHLFAEAKDSLGRQLRSDAGVLVGMVISYPIARSEVVTTETNATYRAWETTTLAWLKSRFPTTLRSVVQHQDETHLHLHAFLLPRLMPDGQLNWAGCHPGISARQSSARRGETKTTQNFRYIESMRGMQDDFFETVSIRFSHYRTGPLRERRSRAEHMKLRSLEKELAEVHALTQRLQSDLAAHTRAANEDAGPPSIISQELPIPLASTGIPAASGKDRIPSHNVQALPSVGASDAEVPPLVKPAILEAAQVQTVSQHETDWQEEQWAGNDDTEYVDDCVTYDVDSPEGLDEGFDDEDHEDYCDEAGWFEDSDDELIEAT